MKYELLTMPGDDGYYCRISEGGLTVCISSNRGGAEYLVYVDEGYLPRRYRWCNGLLEAQSIAVEWLSGT